MIFLLLKQCVGVARHSHQPHLPCLVDDWLRGRGICRLGVLPLAETSRSVQFCLHQRNQSHTHDLGHSAINSQHQVIFYYFPIGKHRKTSKLVDSFVHSGIILLYFSWKKIFFPDGIFFLCQPYCFVLTFVFVSGHCLCFSWWHNYIRQFVDFPTRTNHRVPADTATVLVAGGTLASVDPFVHHLQRQLARWVSKFGAHVLLCQFR